MLPVVLALTLADLFRLAAAGLDDAEARLQQLFAWRYESEASAAKTAFALAGVVLSPLLAAVFDENAVNREAAFGYAAGSFLLVTVGTFRLWRLRFIEREFLTSVVLLGRISRLLSP